ncbi:LamG domain-containing protein [bacterium]|nr:LamG domain-containing protein [Akkermansiaceae bacterium]MDB4573425.1 LamG domain-containing protein [bacterium]
MKKLCAHLMAVLFVSCGFAFGQGLNDGLVAYYPFNGNANDESGNGLNGTIVGATFTEGIQSDPSGALQFNGVHYVSVGSPDSLKLVDDFTISSWALLEGGGRVNPRILSFGQDNGYELLITNPGDQLKPMFSYGGTSHIATKDIELNTWFNFTVTKLDNVIRLYLNGNLILEEQNNRTPVFGTEFRFGEKSQSGDGPDDQWTGKIDITRIYNRALSSTSVSDLYELEKPQNPMSGKILWSLGADDDAQDGEGDNIFDDPATLNGVAFNVSGVRETGQQDLPGNPANVGGLDENNLRDVDDDYYFSGVYTSAAGDYTPVGTVPTNELFYDRAVTNGDPNMRWHFNLQETENSYDKFQFTIDFYNLNESNDGDISGYDLTFWVDGKQIGEMQPHMDTNLSAGQSWDFDLDDLGGIEKVGPGFDHYIEVRTTPTGSARWASLDYVKLEGFKSTIIEPLAPVLDLQALYESDENETILIDATPSEGHPTTFDYQWCFNGFKIPVNLGGSASSFEISSLPDNEGTWSVTVTNSEGSIEQSFEYRLYADSDSDGLSDGYEEVISKTDINNPDTDNDGLGDGDEVNTYSTNPNFPDSDSDGFTDLYELETAYDPNSAESVPDALVEIMTAIEVKFNAALGATYAIEFSTDNQTWDVIEDDIVGEGGAIERLYSKQEYPTGFFRVERKDQ